MFAAILIPEVLLLVEKLLEEAVHVFSAIGLQFVEVDERSVAVVTACARWEEEIPRYPFYLPNGQCL